MRFIIHVIDDASQHEKTENHFTMVSSIALDNATCEVLRSDAFYTVEADTPMDAVTILSNKIRVKNSEGEEVLLSEGFSQTHSNLKITDFSGGEAESLISDSNVKVVNNAYSEFLMASCHIPMEKDNKSWVELHNVYFYVTEETKLIEI